MNLLSFTYYLSLLNTTSAPWLSRLSIISTFFILKSTYVNIITRSQYSSISNGRNQMRALWFVFSSMIQMVLMRASLRNMINMYTSSNLNSPSFIWLRYGTIYRKWNMSVIIKDATFIPNYT